MRRIVSFILLPAMLFLASCSGSKQGWSEGDWERCARIVSTVPSDALTIRYAVDCRKSSFAVDSNSIFSSLGLRSLKGMGLAVSECYNGSVVQVLSLAPVPDSFISDIFDERISEGYDLWVARYSDEKPLCGNWTYWQFTDKAVIYGVEGKADLSVIR